MADSTTEPAPATAPAADAFDALAATRPRVRRDVLFTQTPGGVLFHNADGGFHLTGRTAYRFAALVLPHLTGRHRLDEVCAGFGPAQRAMAAELVRTLYARDFARDIPEADALRPAPEDAAGQRFAAQIAYIDHYTDAAPDRFARYRAARVAVLGTDETARWVALGLVRNGCGTVGLAADFPDVTGEAAQLAEEGCPVSLNRLPDPAEGPAGPRWTGTRSSWSPDPARPGSPTACSPRASPRAAPCCRPGPSASGWSWARSPPAPTPRAPPAAAGPAPCSASARTSTRAPPPPCGARWRAAPGAWTRACRGR